MKVMQISPCISGTYTIVGETDINQIITEINIKSQPEQIYEGEVYFPDG